MNKRYRFGVHKLVRDKSGASLRAAGIVTHEHILKEEDYHAALKKKLAEEINELMIAKSAQELLEECADVLEVMHALIKMHNWSSTDLEAARQAKFTKFGGFYERVYAETIEMDDDNKHFDHFSADPLKYPRSQIDKGTLDK